MRTVKTIAVIAEPATLVPGSASMSMVAAAPMSASASKIAVPPPTGCALNLIWPGAEFTKLERVSGATFDHVAVAVHPLHYLERVPLGQQGVALVLAQDVLQFVRRTPDVATLDVHDVDRVSMPDGGQEAYGRHITINATGAIAAVLGEIGFPYEVARGVAVVSRAAGLVGHILEERREPAARFIWELAEREVPYAAEG